MSPRLAWPPALRGWRLWVLIVVVLAGVVRVALPSVLRAVLVSQASQALNARIEVGDVDLVLWRGGLALNEVAVRPPAPVTTSVQPGATEAAGPAQPPAAPAAAPATVDPPLIAWKRFAIELQWLPLFQRTVRLREVLLDTPYVAVDRLENGEINLAALIPKSTAEPTPAASPTLEAESGAGWGFGVDRFVLRSGGLRFRDLMIKRVEPIEISLDSIEVADIAIRPGVYGEPARVHVDLKLGEGTVQIDARLAVTDAGVAVDADLKAERLSLHHTRVYIPRVGWSDLHGSLGAALKYQLETGTKNQVAGTVSLADLTVRVPGLEQPALAWKSLEVQVDSVDLVAQRAQVAKVTLVAPSIPVRVRGADPLPLLATGKDAAPAPKETIDEGATLRRAQGERTDPPTARAEPVEARSPETKPWTWAVAAIDIAEATVPLIDASQPAAVGLNISAKNIGSVGNEASPVHLVAKIGTGTLDVEGTLQREPIGFRGKIALDQLALPEVVAVAGALPPNVLQSGQLSLALDVAAGATAPTAGDVQVQGTIALEKPQIAGADPKEFSVAAQQIAIAIDRLHVPGVLVPPAAGAVVPGPIQLELRELRIAAPQVQITNTPDGVVLPPLAAGPPAPAASPAPAPPAPAPAPPTPIVELGIGTLLLTEGRIGVTDRTVRPHYVTEVAPLEVDVRDLRWPALAMKSVRVKATTDGQGQIEVTGAMSPSGGQFEVTTRDVGLVALEPYATKYSPYSITGGSLSVTTKGSYGPRGYKAKSKITLHDLDLGGQQGESVFQEQFGIPVSMALALLRDVEGKIVIDLALEADEKGTKIGLMSVVGGALRRAIVNALASPLKLFGAVTQGGKVQAVAPPAIAFQIGLAEPAAGGATQLEQLGQLLATRPALGVTLETAPTARDHQWLREEVLRQELGEPAGVWGTVRNFVQRGQRVRIRAALAARARGEEGKLDPEDEETLTQWLAERPPVPVERVYALAEARLAQVELNLCDQHAIDAARIARGEVPKELSADKPVVRVRVHAVRPATAPTKPAP